MVRGADIDVEDNDGRTAIIRSARNGNCMGIRMLIDVGASLDIVGCGGTAISWCTGKLVIYGMIVDAKKKNASSAPLHLR